MKKRFNYETLMPIIILGVALIVGLIISICTKNNKEITEDITTETISLATSTDMASPTDLLESIDANEEDISTEQNIEEIGLSESETTEKTTVTTEEVTTTEYYIEPTTQITTEVIVTETPTTEAPITEAPATETPEGMTYLGKYTLTAYCACASCCGKSDGITASGTQATAGRTVACNSLPFGTVLSINGHQYVVEDRGGMSSYVIDVFFDSHEAALNFGRQTADVYIVN